VTLTAGTRLGPYEILSALGAGGMGEVYRARDTKLGREVAIKILLPAVANDPDRLARFSREAQVLASLNHPSIAHIHGLEESDGLRALVMELVEGPTLAERIAHGAIPVNETLAIARQIADALETAHDQGIIHRDLKPTNIKVREDGTVKVLDFGLAKAMDASGSSNANATMSPTLSMQATQAGFILGTAAYMSPEQAAGKPVDRRADVWSFGVVLWEMLTGTQLFNGETISHTLADVLRADIDFAKLPADIPPTIRELVRRCLDRDVKRRLRDIGEARIVIENVLSGKTSETAFPPLQSRAPFGLAITGWSMAAVLAVLAAAMVWRLLHPALVPPAHVVRFTTSLPLTNVTGGLALSHDGSQLAFVGGPKQQIHVRAMDQLDARPLAGTENAAWLCFSPDAKWISFITGRGRDSTLKKVSVAGGPAQTLAPAVAIVGPPGNSWAQTNDIFFTDNGALKRIHATGGKAETLAAPDTSIRYYMAPQLLPDGNHLLVTASTTGGLMTGRATALDLRTGAKKTLLERVGVAQYLPTATTTGHLAYYDPGTASLMAVPFDLTRMEVDGAPAPVVEGIQSSRGPFGLFGISDSGTLVYGPGTPGALGSILVWVDRTGTEQPAGGGPRAYSSLRLAPDGKRVAVAISGDADDIWIYDTARGTLNRLTSEGHDLNPVWTPDGMHVIYERHPSVGSAILWAPADGSGPSTVLVAARQGSTISPSSVSPDGRTLIAYSPAEKQMLLVSLPDASSPASRSSPFLDSRYTRFRPAFSPDAKWVAYRSDESGQPEVYVTPYPGPGGRFPISTDGGDFPRWSSNGRELFYRQSDKVMAVDVETNPQFRAGTPRLLFGGIQYSNSYDLDPEGKRFLMIKLPTAQPSATDRVEIVLNWFEELKARVPTK
jgi:Tol biopolymer transport system component